LRQGALGAVLGFAGAFLFIELGFAGVLKQPELRVLTIGVMLGAALGAAGRARWILFADVPAIALYFLIASTPVTTPLARAWVRNDSLVAGLDGILVLSSGVTSDTVMETSGTSRLLTGLDLLRSGVAPRLITTEVRVDGGRGPLSIAMDQRRLMRIARADSAWIPLALAQSTHDEVEKAVAGLQPRGIRRIAVVTSPMHTRRTCATLEKRGFAVVCIPAQERDANRWHPASASDRLASFRALMYERIGWWYYRLKGRL
jgi:uncharacterized SAM-binding protein YcdF (DUF218 family)